MMNKHLRESVLDLLRDSEKEGVAVRDWFEEEMIKLDTVFGIETIEDAKGKQIAITILRKMLKRISVEQKTQPTKVDYN